MIKVMVEGRGVDALVDSGCSKSILSQQLASQVGKVQRGRRPEVVTADGSVATSTGVIEVILDVAGKRLYVECTVMKRVLPGVEIILGMDIIRRLGGVTVGTAIPAGEKVIFGAAAVDVKVSRMPDVLEFGDRDFNAKFDGTKWTVKWKWKYGEPALSNKDAQYRMRPDVESQFEAEVTEWINKGWLRPHVGDVDGIVPLMAVVQANKGKVRPVMDFRELNQHVESHTGTSNVCAETLRKWRKMHGRFSMLDLRSAYLQLHVDEGLWRHQVVEFKGKRYMLTRLGFASTVHLES